MLDIKYDGQTKCMSVAALAVAAGHTFRLYGRFIWGDPDPGLVWSGGRLGGKCVAAALAELPITCGYGLINVKVCIKSVKAVMMWVKLLTG